MLLVVIFAGAMLGFVFARLQYLNFDGIYRKNAAIGEWYWYQDGHYRIGIMLHLCCCLPAGFLMVWQFVPVIRHKFLLFHRINGHIIILLVLVSNTGALMIVRRAFGGDTSIQAAIGFLVILTTVGLAMAYINIKRLQIDQHRAWMLRTMFYLGVIITERIFLIISALVTTMVGSYYTVWSCKELEWVAEYQGEANITAYMQHTYPGCFIAPGNVFPNTSAPMLNNKIAVNANFNSDDLASLGAAMRLNFGQTIWIALMLHAIGVELYLNLTPRESQRLRKISYQKQLEAGMSNAGSAGLVPERFGDADEWIYKERDQEVEAVRASK